MVRSNPGFQPSQGDPLTMRTFDTFFAVLDLLFRAEVTVVAEAAFQDRVWRPALERFAGLAELRIVRCVVAAEVGIARRRQRLADDPVRRAHADQQSLDDPAEARRYYTAFDHISLPAPTIEVDTTDGYRPDLAAITTFLDGPGRTRRA